MSRVALSRNIFAIVSSYLSSLIRTAFFFSFCWIRFSLFFLSRGISSLVTFLRLPSSSGTVSVVRSGRVLALSLSFPFHRIGLVSLSHISSPSISLFSASSVLVVPPMYLTFVHSFPLARVAFRGVASRSILTNTPLVFPFFSLSRARTYIHIHTCIHSDAYVPTSPWLNEIRTRVSTGDARDVSGVCVTRTCTCVYTCAATRHGRIYTRVNAATWTRDGQTPEIFDDPDVAVLTFPRKPLRL